MTWWTAKLEKIPCIQTAQEEELVISTEPIEEKFDEKEEEPIVLTREYCSSCITPSGELKCPRRHRCKVCKCYLDDDEWFAQFRK